MEPLIPNKATFLSKPTRVSRLYPILTVILMVASSGLTYWWQISRITADSLIRERDQEIALLNAQVDSLREQQTKDQQTLATQSAELQTKTEQLAAIETELNSRQKELSEAQDQLKQQQNQLSSNATELEKLRSRPPLFSFQNTSSLPDAASKQEDIKQIVTDAYDYIRDLYGNPYLLNQITISFVDSLSIAGSAGEITIENGPEGISITIKLKDFNKNKFQDVNTLIHEIIHGFHGIAVFESSAFEEGIAVAATDAVMERMINDGKLPKYPYLYVTIGETTYSQWNSTLDVPKDSESFYSHPDVAKIYQMAGYAWRQLYQEDANFFKRLNERYYKDVQEGKKASDSLVKQHIVNFVPSVDGTPTAVWLSHQTAFNPN